MDILKTLITIDQEAEQAIYLQISNAFIHNIRAGRLRKGLKLPGSRKLANILNINRMTVVAAYEELQIQGWIESIPRKGTFITQNLPDVNPQNLSDDKQSEPFPPKASFPITKKRSQTFSPPVFHPHKLVINDGFPDVRLAPMEALIRAMRSIESKPTFKKYLGYGDSQGTQILRKILSAHLSVTRGLPVSPENILITRGTQMGISLVAKLLIQPRDHVVVGEPGYFGANHVFRAMGATLNRVPVDEEGLDIDVVEQLCKQKKITLLYVIPHHHHPTTVTLTPQRRIRLLELSARYNFAVIEDDYDYDFHYAGNPVLPMASLSQQGNVIYLGTLTKTIAPAIRIGFMVAAENIIQFVSGLRRTMDFQGDNMTELAIADLYKDGTIARHIKKSVKLYRKRRDHFCKLLKNYLGNNVSFMVPEGGMSVWVRFNGKPLKKISQTAFKKGLVISDGQEYNTFDKNYNAARLGFASLNLEEQKHAISILAECMP